MRRKFLLIDLCLVLLSYAFVSCGSGKEDIPPVPVEKPVAVSGVTLDKASLELLVDSTAQLTATVSPADADNKAVTWKSSDTSVATVSDSGLVTAVGEGTATITVTTTDGGKTATCAVNVTKPEDDPDDGGDDPDDGGDDPDGGGDDPDGGGDDPDDEPIHVSGVTLNKTSVTVYTYSTLQLTATISPSDAEDKTVTWSSSNPSIASVDENGKVKALKTGTATITVTTTDGGHTASCTVKVITYVPTPDPDIAVSSIALSQTELALNEGQTANLSATITPSNATDKAVTWSSSDKSIATVNAQGKVTAIKAGEAIITATASNGLKAICKVIVRGEVTGEVDSNENGSGGSTGEIEW